MGLSSVNVAVLFVSDVERSRSFYRDTLGMTLKFDGEDDFGIDAGGILLMAVNRAGAADLLTEDAVASMQPGAAACQLVSFVDDVDAVYEELKGKGVEFIREPIDRDWGIRTAHF